MIKGLHEAQRVQSVYLEVRFEDLIDNAQQVLLRVSQFVECELDYEQIRQHAVGTLKNTNSTFKSDGQILASKPVGRWKRLLSYDQVLALESCIGDLLHELGYELTKPSGLGSNRFRLIKTTYPLFYSTKHWLKQHTRAGKFTSIDRMKAA